MRRPQVVFQLLVDGGPRVDHLLGARGSEAQLLHGVGDPGAWPPNREVVRPQVILLLLVQGRLRRIALVRESLRGHCCVGRRGLQVPRAIVKIRFLNHFTQV